MNIEQKDTCCLVLALMLNSRRWEDRLGALQALEKLAINPLFKEYLLDFLENQIEALIYDD
jgi:hypothetical protein